MFVDINLLFANSLDPDQAQQLVRQHVRLGLAPNCLTLFSLKLFLFFEKS